MKHCKTCKDEMWHIIKKKSKERCTDNPDVGVEIKDKNFDPKEEILVGGGRGKYVHCKVF